MRLRNIPSARQELAESPYVISETGIFGLRGRWRELFPDALPEKVSSPKAASRQALYEVPPEKASSPKAASRQALHIEIGMGKGQFLLELARRNPEINYVGIERYSSVLVHPVRRLDQLAEAGTPLRNIFLIRMDAERLTEVFAPGEVNRIFLNFSDPWPKDRHAKRRLPGRVFLERYAQVLAPGGQVEFKTDNRSLFDFALEEADKAGWAVSACTRDLHHDPVMNEGNVMTEYERKFSQLGNPICKLVEQPGAVEDRPPG